MAENRIIGRDYEQHILQNICEEDEARLIAVYGRRRVGKTYLVKYFFNEKFDFFFTGSFETPMKVQLSLFKTALEQYSGRSCPSIKNWFDAFEQLKDYIQGLRKKRIVVFLDELPWMDTPRSNFLAAFTYFWNNWGSTCDGLKLIVCGSATSWMLDKIVGDKGGLYGRSSRSIYIAPFNLSEVDCFLRLRKGIVWNRYQILELYMILGGIPYYLDMLEKGLPFARNIDNLFYRQGAPLRTEYDFLFRSLFKSATTYRQVVEVLATKNKGLTLKEIKEEIGIGDSGGLSEVLDNLCRCDFIRKYSAYGKKEKGSIYQLTDLFSLYYLKFIGKRTGLDEHYWTNIRESARNAWAGYAFEQVCLHHIGQIRHALGIPGILTNTCTWSLTKQTDSDGTEWPGMQIDLLLCRGDHVIDVCEMKYCQSEFVVSAEYEKKLRQRNSTFAHFTNTKDALHTVLVTTFGLTPNLHSSCIYSTVTMDDLFKKSETI
ncbi:MAG: AAA family ATPase [Bacteroidales bacterium]|nr:AAA family ATPase [Bacteroidales bacterium]